MVLPRQLQTGDEMSNPIIMLDPGHGGKDPGAVHGGVKECDVVVRLAEALSTCLVDSGIDVAFSRPPQMAADEYIAPWIRARQANYLGATAFISLHANAFTKPTPRGIRFYVYSEGYTPRERKSEVLAAAIQTQCRLTDLLMPVGRVHRANFCVLRRTAVPAVLIETGFLSTPADRELLTSDVFISRVAKVYSTGINAWMKRMGEQNA